MFSDLFADTGRWSVPPRIVATVMVCQKLFGLSDREAVEAFTFDARWKYACGGLDFDYPSFAHTVVVDMRARLARSEKPERIRDVTVAAACDAGLLGAKRVLDRGDERRLRGRHNERSPLKISSSCVFVRDSGKTSHVVVVAVS